MNINDLSIVELKATWDFVLYDINELEKEAKKQNISPNKIPAYQEVKEIENKLYHELLNITRKLK